MTPDLLAGQLVLREVDIAVTIVRYAVLPRSFEIVEGFFVDIPNRRYEETKGATTAKQFIDAGFNRTDLAYDVKKGFVKVLQGEIPKKRKQDHSKRGYWTEQQKDAMAARYLKILDEYDS